MFLIRWRWVLIESVCAWSFYFSGDDGPYKIFVVDATVCGFGVLQDLFCLFLAQGLSEGVHDLLEVCLSYELVLFWVSFRYIHRKRKRLSAILTSGWYGTVFRKIEVLPQRTSGGWSVPDAWGLLSSTVRLFLPLWGRVGRNGSTWLNNWRGTDFSCFDGVGAAVLFVFVDLEDLL